MRWWLSSVAVVCVACGGESNPAACEDTPEGCVAADVCGDDVVTGSEMCDGSTSMTCAEAGLGSGAVVCTSACEIDTTGCSFTCGDGLVQPALDERCDGDDLAGATCISEGFDYGALACDAECQLVDCQTYGWRTLLTAPSRVVSADANRRGTIALTETGDVMAVWDGVTSTVTGYLPSSSAVTTNPSGLILSYSNGYATFDGAWHHHPHNRALGLHRLAATTTGLLFIVPLSSQPILQVTLASDAITELPAIGEVPREALVVSDWLIVNTGTLTGIVRWTGASWSTITTLPFLSRLQRAGPNAIFAAETSGYRPHYRFSVLDTNSFGTEIQYLEGSFDVTFGDGVVLSGNQLPRYVATNRLHFVTVASTGLMPVGNSFTRVTVQASDGSVLALDAGVQRFEPQLLPTRLPAPPVGIVRVIDREMSFCGDSIGTVLHAESSETRPATPGSCVDFLTSELGTRGPHYVASASGTWRWNPATQAYVQELVGDTAELEGPLGTPIARSAGKVHARSGASGTWIELPMPNGCTLVDIAASSDPAQPTHALAQCAGETRVLTWVGSAWMLRAATTTVYDTLVAAQDGSLFVASASLHSVGASSIGPALHVGPLTSIAALSATEVFARDATSDILHIQNGVESRIRTAGGPFAVTTDEITIWNPVARQFEVLPRMRSRFPGYGL